MTTDEFGTLIIVISRDEVERRDLSGPLIVLKRLMSSPEMMREFRTRVDIAFHGYDHTSEELFEIKAVRDYIVALDSEFPYWLYFLSRSHTGLQCIALSFLPPFLTAEARQQIHKPRLFDLFERRWGPALHHICSAANVPDSEAGALLESASAYFIDGPVPPA